MADQIRNIVVGYDGFDREEALSVLAVALAEEHDARLHVVHVVHPPPRWPWGSWSVSPQQLQQALIEQRERLLVELTVPARERGVDVRIAVRAGTAHEELIREAMEARADLVLITDSPDDHHGRRGFGEVTQHMLRACPCPVLATRNVQGREHDHIMAAVDVADSEEDRPNGAILDLAVLLARRARAHLDVFYAWSVWGESLLHSAGHLSSGEIAALEREQAEASDSALRELLTRHPIDGVEHELIGAKGDLRHLIPELVHARRVDLVVMGTLPRGGLAGLIVGNTAERIINTLPCSVLVVKPESFTSPVSNG